MTLIVDYALTSTFAGVNSLQALGTIDTGNNLPNGIGTALTITDGVMKSTITENDTPTALGMRSEITAPPDTLAERWYTWEFMLPTDFAPTNVPIMLMQIHDTPDGGDPARAVPFSFWYAQNETFQCYVPLATLPTEGVNSLLVASAPVQRGVWYSACFRALWSITATGFREFYLNDVALFRQFNLATTYNDVVGNYFKVGCYDGTGGANFGTATAYYRNVKIYSGNDGYETVIGNTPLLPPQILEI
jgi:hypothetical protein